MAAQALAAYEDVATTTAILYCMLLHDRQGSLVKSLALTLPSLPASRGCDFRFLWRVHLFERANLQPAQDRSHCGSSTSHSRWRYWATRGLSA
jgi:hypothetical protein